MRPCGLLPLFLFCVVGAAAQTSDNAAESQPGTTVSVRGMAFDSRTGKPLSGVHVMLTSDAGLESEIVYGAMSDAQGRFSIPDIPAGDYTGSAEKRGFLFLPDRKKTNVTWYGALNLKFKANQRPADLVMPMVERAIIAGRVLDEHGDPLINARVAAFSLNRENGAAGSTNGRGEFRLSVPPGKYTVEGSRYSEADTTGSASGYERTFYPSTTQIRSATVVESFAGRVVSGVEIRLVRPAAFHVSGEITGFPDGDRSLDLFWTSTDNEKQIEGWASGRLELSPKKAGASGEMSSINFYSSSLPVGSYYFWAECCAGADDELRSPVAQVTLSDSDVTGIALELVPGVEITGTVIRPRGFVQIPGQAISVRLPLEGRQILGAGPQGEVNADGNFTISKVFPGRYRLEVSSLPEDVYVQSVILNHSAVHAGLLDLSGGAEGAKLKIVLSGGAARLSGLVKKAKADAPQKYSEVLLFPESESQAVDQAECLSVGGNESGAYSFQSLPPGRYRILIRAHYTQKQCEEAAAEIRRGLIVESIELKPGEKTVKNLRIDEAADESRP